MRRISTLLGISGFCGTSLDLAIFNAIGEQLFRTEMRENAVRLDDLKLPAGDLLLAYRAVLGPRSDGDPAKCGVPRFKFSAK